LDSFNGARIIEKTRDEHYRKNSRIAALFIVTDVYKRLERLGGVVQVYELKRLFYSTLAYRMWGESAYREQAIYNNHVVVLSAVYAGQIMRM
jgi:hypothetical protein